MIIGNKRELLTFVTLIMFLVAGPALSTEYGTMVVVTIRSQSSCELIRDIPLRVRNDNDVWLNASGIEPDHFLLGHDLNLQVDIYYNIPVTHNGTDNKSSVIGDILEVCVIVSMVEKDGTERLEFVNETVRLEELNTRPKGIKIFNYVAPWESFADSLLRWEAGNNDTMNFMKVEIRDIPGGANMSYFEESEDNNVIIVELFAVPQINQGSPGGGPNNQETPNRIIILFVGVGLILFFFIPWFIMVIIPKFKPGISNKEEPPDKPSPTDPSIYKVDPEIENEGNRKN